MGFQSTTWWDSRFAGSPGGIFGTSSNRNCTEPIRWNIQNTALRVRRLAELLKLTTSARPADQQPSVPAPAPATKAAATRGELAPAAAAAPDVVVVGAAEIAAAAALTTAAASATRGVASAAGAGAGAERAARMDAAGVAE